MLKDIKKMYKDIADVRIPDWQKQDKNDLFKKYCELSDKGDSDADYYLAACICKFFYLVSINYNNQLLKIASEEDTFDWLTDTLLYVASHRPWENPDNSLYNDPKGPEKAMSVKYNSLRTNYFVSLTRDKRSANKLIYTLDDSNSSAQFLDEGNDFVLHAKDISLYVVADIIKYYWNKLDYLTCFLLDSIINIDKCQSDFGFLLRHLRQLDDIYLRGFCETYGFTFEQVKTAKEYILDPRYHKPDKFKQEVSTKLYILSHDERILSITEEYRKGD
mgnify:CR=1 FL=1